MCAVTSWRCSRLAESDFTRPMEGNDESEEETCCIWSCARTCHLAGPQRDRAGQVSEETDPHARAFFGREYHGSRGTRDRPEDGRTLGATGGGGESTERRRHRGQQRCCRRRSRRLHAPVSWRRLRRERFTLSEASL